NGGDDDEINLVAGDTGGLHRAQGGLGGHIRSKLVLRREAPLLDAGARRDPFVGGVHHFFELLIGEDFGGDVGADAGNGTGPALKVEFGAGIPEFGRGGRTHAERGAGAAASHSASRSLARAISRAMMSLTRCWTASAAMRMACMMARSRAEPWALKTGPLKPRSGAPPGMSGSIRRLMERKAFCSSNAPSLRF